MSARYLPHTDELIDHEAEHLNHRLRRYERRVAEMRWPWDRGQGWNPVLDPDPLGELPDPLLDED